MTTALATLTFDEMTRLAESVAKSGLFGMKTGDQALALMAISAAEGVHPALAARDYHVIQGRPTLKADAMLSRFQSAGGKMTMMEYTDTRVVAEFSHPQGGKVTIDWDIERAKRAGLTGKDVWKQYARQMLRARVISEGVRTVFPGATAGMMVPEEAADVAPEAVEKDITPEKPATGVAALQARVAELVPPAEAEVDTDTGEVMSGVAAPTENDIVLMIQRAESRDEISAAVDLARDWTEAQKAPLRAVVDKRRKQLREAYESAARG